MTKPSRQPKYPPSPSPSPSQVKPARARQDLAVYRVNARFDAEVQAKLDYLAGKLECSASDVLREAVNHYYDDIKAKSARRRGFLDSLVGAAQGPLPADLSENYKKYATDAIVKKHGHR